MAEWCLFDKIPAIHRNSFFVGTSKEIRQKRNLKVIPDGTTMQGRCSAVIDLSKFNV